MWSLHSFISGFVLGALLIFIGCLLWLSPGYVNPFTDRRSRGRTPPTGCPGAATGSTSEPLSDTRTGRYSSTGLMALSQAPKADPRGWKLQVAAAIDVETKNVGTKNIVLRHLKIHKCDDPLMWYAGKVGQRVPYRGVWPESGWHSGDDVGYSNVVRFDDADLVTEVIPKGE